MSTYIEIYIFLSIKYKSSNVVNSATIVIISYLNFLVIYLKKKKNKINKLVYKKINQKQAYNTDKKEK